MASKVMHETRPYTRRSRMIRRILMLAPELKALDPTWPAPTIADFAACTDEGIEDLGVRIRDRIGQLMGELQEQESSNDGT